MPVLPKKHDNKSQLSYYRFIHNLLKIKKITDITTYYYLYYQFIVIINKLNDELIQEYDKLNEKINVPFKLQKYLDIDYVFNFMNQINGYIFLYYNYLKTSSKLLPKFLYYKLSIDKNISMSNYILDDKTEPIDLTDLIGGASINNNYINNEITGSTIIFDTNTDIDENKLLNLYLNKIVIELVNKDYTNEPKNDYLPPSIEPVLYYFYEINKLQIMKTFVDDIDTIQTGKEKLLKTIQIIYRIGAIKIKCN
jgi:hypothetical protein